MPHFPQPHRPTASTDPAAPAPGAMLRHLFHLLNRVYDLLLQLAEDHRDLPQSNALWSAFAPFRANLDDHFATIINIFNTIVTHRGITIADYHRACNYLLETESQYLSYALAFRRAAELQRQAPFQFLTSAALLQIIRATPISPRIPHFRVSFKRLACSFKNLYSSIFLHRLLDVCPSPSFIIHPLSLPIPSPLPP